MKVELPYVLRDINVGRPKCANGIGPMFTYASIYSTEDERLCVSATLDYCVDWLECRAREVGAEGEK